jgi:prevent-host-death family protein
MAIRTSDIVPISEARARLTELAEEVGTQRTEKVLTKNGTGYVALIDARRLDEYHALADQYAQLVLMLEVWVWGQVLPFASGSVGLGLGSGLAFCLHRA